MSEQVTLIKIKQDIEDCLGRKVLLKTNKGKRKVKVNEGVIQFAYPSVFTVKIINGLDLERTVSYSYSDILTETVELTVCGNPNYIL
ncbi:Veg family protein [Helicovermis profundi]|uniref:Veg family protein n=1 Tax=Helicovermis profundi TaxID=3065157 RepID=A0AAU9EMR8_9FIRM|nr:Veg family protein [Clostridia bacterium S502]